MRKIITFGCLLFLVACAGAPKLKPASGMGAVVGKVETRAHKDMIKKAKTSGSEYASTDGKIRYSDKMVNYDKLDDIYVGLVSSPNAAQAPTVLTSTENGFDPRALAIDTGSRILINNATSQSLTFYVVDPNSDAIEEIPPVAPGGNGELIVPMKGLLEIATDERDDLVSAVLSLPGMQVRRVASGKYYTFNDLTPGSYRLVFWYWRLGMLERPVSIKADTVLEVNEYLSVDRLFSY